MLCSCGVEGLERVTWLWGVRSGVATVQAGEMGPGFVSGATCVPWLA